VDLLPVDSSDLSVVAALAVGSSAGVGDTGQAASEAGKLDSAKSMMLSEAPATNDPAGIAGQDTLLDLDLGELSGFPGTSDNLLEHALPKLPLPNPSLFDNSSFGQALAAAVGEVEQEARGLIADLLPLDDSNLAIVAALVVGTSEPSVSEIESDRVNFVELLVFSVTEQFKAEQPTLGEVGVQESENNPASKGTEAKDTDLEQRQAQEITAHQGSSTPNAATAPNKWQLPLVTGALLAAGARVTKAPERRLPYHPG